MIFWMLKNNGLPDATEVAYAAFTFGLLQIKYGGIFRGAWKVFQQDVLAFEKWYQGEYNARMMGDYIWGLVHDTKQQYRKKRRKSMCLE